MGELIIHCMCVFLFPQARFDAGELITQRELVSRQVSEDLTERAATFGLILDDVSLVRSGWPILQQCPCIIFISFYLEENIYCVLSDTLDLWQGIHRGCWNEAGGSAGGWEGPFHRRKGIIFTHRSSLLSLYYLCINKVCLWSPWGQR